MKPISIYTVFLLTLFFIGCGKPQIERLGPDSIVLAFGDSLTFGYGADREESYPVVLEGMLGCKVVNAGVSGEDTAAGLKRLADELSEHRPDLVILCFGGNDMLREQPSEQTQANLKTMIDTIKARNADIVLLGVPKPGLLLQVPDFYEALSEEYELPYDGKVIRRVLRDGYLKSDYIHPNGEGYRLMAEAVFELIKDSEL